MQNTLPRNTFDALTNLDLDTSRRCNQLLRDAIASKKLAATYDNIEYDFQKRRAFGWCLNYDFYDCTDAAVLVQQRETECHKYGRNVHKAYFIIRRCGRGVVVTKAPKARVRKLAKVSTALGQVIDTLEGRTHKPLKQASPFGKKWIGYKIVEQRDASYYSVFDADFEWALGKARIEAASDNHTGGYYVFASREQALAKLQANVVFNTAWQAGKQLVLVECECAGRKHQHDNNKLCVSFCRPTRIVEVISAPLAEAA